MDEATKEALIKDQVMDITTTGQKTGRPRRIEIWAHYQDGKVYITGTPGACGWYANMVAHPGFTLHLKQSVQRDIATRAIAITDMATRRSIFTRMAELESRMESLRGNVEEWVERSPLVEVELAETS